MALFTYLKDTQRYLRDQKQLVHNPFDLIEHINDARQWIAAQTQAIRVLPPSSGSIASFSVTAGGSGYTVAPTVTITAPDAIGTGFVQAVGTAHLTAGAVSSVTVGTAGTGYVNPIVTLSGGGGTGATATATLTSFLKTVVGQEVYTFTSVDTLIQASFPGVDSIIGVQSVAASWGSMKPMLRQCDWSSFQAYLRSINAALQNFPSVWAQYGQGASGSVYVWPSPSTTTQMEWDCYCLPVALADDTTVEALPYPFTRAVPYLAAQRATVGDADASRYFLAEAKRIMGEGRAAVSPAIVPDFYGD